MGTSTNNKLSSKELQFCLNYVNTGDIEKSAFKAGYESNALKIGNLLIGKDSIADQIDELYKQKRKNLLYKACSGYEKLAFGSITDAVKLMYSKKLDIKEIQDLDLFNVSEIKIKDGALEIKFFDRLRALEKLQQLDFTDQSQAYSFYDAIEKGTVVFNSANEGAHQIDEI